MNWTTFWDKVDSFLEALVYGDKVPSVTVILPTVNTTPTEPNSTPSVPSTDTLAPDWMTQEHNYHNVRVLCDLSYLTLEEKNLICACVYQESQFYNYLPNGKPVTHQNLSLAGVLLSTDWGICQINDYWHVHKYPDFPSSDYIMANPQKAVQFMIDAYKEGGLKAWVSFSSGAYLKWLSTDSPMWALATPTT